jgi:hypothetical protein
VIFLSTCLQRVSQEGTILSNTLLHLSTSRLASACAMQTPTKKVEVVSPLLFHPRWPHPLLWLFAHALSLSLSLSLSLFLRVYLLVR